MRFQKQEWSWQTHSFTILGAGTLLECNIRANIRDNELREITQGEKIPGSYWKGFVLNFAHLNKSFLSIYVNLKNSFSIPLPTTRPETGSNKSLSGSTKI